MLKFRGGEAKGERSRFLYSPWFMQHLAVGRGMQRVVITHKCDCLIGEKTNMRL